MFGRFLPTTCDFFEYFDRHASITVKAAALLWEMVNQSAAEQGATAKKIAAYEKEADEIAHQCILMLHKTFITPFDHDDIYRLIKRLDDIIDAIEEVSARIVIYKIDMKEREIGHLLKILLAAAEEIERLMKRWHAAAPLAELQESLKKVHQLENDGDVVVRNAIGTLFEEKDAIFVLKWKEIYEGIEEAIDCCKSIGDIVEGVIIESS